MRIDKVNELIKQELSKILLEEIEFNNGALVTILSVDTAKNLDSAKIWISVLPNGKTREVLNHLSKEIGNIQRILNRKLKMRFVPKISFKIDKSEEYADNIRKVFEEIGEE